MVALTLNVDTEYFMLLISHRTCAGKAIKPSAKMKIQ